MRYMPKVRQKNSRQCHLPSHSKMRRKAHRPNRTTHERKSVIQILQGDCRTVLPTLISGSVNCCVTSPPYFGLRDYGCDSQIGLEATPEDYVAQMVVVFREVRRVLRDDGTLWLNLGDSYSGSGKGGNPDEGKQATNAGSQTIGVLYGTGKTAREAAVTNVTRNVPGLAAKQLIGIPWRVAFALQADGWYLRQDIIWAKPNPMPESVLDRCTKAHEYIFLLSKSERYYFNADAISEPAIYGDPRRPYGSQGAWDMDGRPTEQRHGGELRKSWNGSEFGKTATHQLGRASVKRGGFGGKNTEIPGKEAFRAIQDTRNKRSVWTVASAPYPGAHFATFPPELIKPCILAGCPKDGTVLDPFGGSGTTGQVARDAGCHAILIELNEKYISLSEDRLAQAVLAF